MNRYGLHGRVLRHISPGKSIKGSGDDFFSFTNFAPQSFKMKTPSLASS